MARLQGMGVKFWMDTAEIPVGEAFVAQIGDALSEPAELAADC